MLPRRGEWRRLQNDPTTALGWWWRSVRPRRSFRSIPLPKIEPGQPSLKQLVQTAFLTIIGFSGLTLFLMIILASIKDRLLFILLGGPILLCTVVVLAWFSVNFFWYDPPAELDRLEPTEELGESFPVRIALFDRNLVTGTDWAYATFLDGWLLVEGLRTSFSLRACDVERVSTLDRRGCMLNLHDGQRVQILPYEGDYQFREAVRIWHHYVIESPEGEPIFPPDAVHRSALAKPTFGALVALISVMTGLSVATVSHPSWAPILLAAGGYFLARFATAVDRLNRRSSASLPLEAQNPS